MIMVSGLSCPKTRAGIRKRKRNVSGENVLGYIMPPPTRITGYGSETMKTLKIKIYHGMIWCRQSETKKLFSSAPHIALKLTNSQYFQILQQVFSRQAQITNSLKIQEKLRQILRQNISREYKNQRISPPSNYKRMLIRSSSMSIRGIVRVTLTQTGTARTMMQK